MGPQASLVWLWSSSSSCWYSGASERATQPDLSSRQSDGERCLDLGRIPVTDGPHFLCKVRPSRAVSTGETDHPLRRRHVDTGATARVGAVPEAAHHA